MKKRFAICIAVAFAGIAIFVALQRIKNTEMEQEGRVSYHKKSGDLIQFLTRELQQYGKRYRGCGLCGAARVGRLVYET